VRSVVTIRDVARLANVHPGTVSRALNPETRGLVNEETAERVARAAEQLGHGLIGHVAGPQNTPTGHRRAESFLQAMAEAGLSLRVRGSTAPPGRRPVDL
jgi:DNA-binding LacI/PurR family transcriptional regulator